MSILRRVLRAFLPVMPALALVCPIMAQTSNVPTQTRNWWSPGTTVKDFSEKGKFSELKGKTKVYINVTIGEGSQSPAVAAERNEVLQAVKQSIATEKTLSMVNVPESADFAILVRAAANAGTGERAANFTLALDAETEVSVDVSVLVPGAKQTNGTFVPRMVWDASYTHTQMDVPTSARFAVDGFLTELRKANGTDRKSK